MPLWKEDGTFQVAPAVRRAVLEAVETLKERGAQVTEWSPPGAPHALDLYYGVMSSDGARGITQTLGRDKQDPRIMTMTLLAGRSRPTIAGMGGLLRLLGQHGLAASIRTFGHHDTLHYWRLVEAQMMQEMPNRFKKSLFYGRPSVFLTDEISAAMSGRARGKSTGKTTVAIKRPNPLIFRGHVGKVSRTKS